MKIRGAFGRCVLYLIFFCGMFDAALYVARVHDQWAEPPSWKQEWDTECYGEQGVMTFWTAPICHARVA